jgi:sugar lactone lactonase YvrE
MIDCVVQAADILGEIPLWCDRTSLLWWIDGKRPALQSYDPATGRHRAFRLPEHLIVGSIALTQEGGFLLAANTGLYRFDPTNGLPPAQVLDLSESENGNRLNDGRCDPDGRFWVGSMPIDAGRKATGSLYRIDAPAVCTRVLGDVMLPNSLCWSPDGGTMYFAETILRVTFAFDFDNGTISNRRVFKEWNDRKGMPDGSAVDQDGCVWTAILGDGQLVRLTPKGAVDTVIDMPVRYPTCPVFGGNDLATLFVTSHSQRYSPERLAQNPLAGSLFAVDVGYRGLPEHRFGKGSATEV